MTGTGRARTGLAPAPMYVSITFDPMLMRGRQLIVYVFGIWQFMAREAVKLREQLEHEKASQRCVQTLIFGFISNG